MNNLDFLKFEKRIDLKWDEFCNLLAVDTIGNIYASEYYAQTFTDFYKISLEGVILFETKMDNINQSKEIPKDAFRITSPQKNNLLKSRLQIDSLVSGPLNKGQLTEMKIKIAPLDECERLEIEDFISKQKPFGTMEKPKVLGKFFDKIISEAKIGKNKLITRETRIIIELPEKLQSVDLDNKKWDLQAFQIRRLQIISNLRGIKLKSPKTLELSSESGPKELIFDGEKVFISYNGWNSSQKSHIDIYSIKKETKKGGHKLWVLLMG